MNVTGSCHCRDLTYRATLDPSRIVICHCTDCQKLSGTAFRTIGMMKDTDFELLSGSPTIYLKTAASGRLREQAFCSHCGSQLYSSSTGSGPRDIGLRLGTLDERIDVVPKLQIWTRSMQAWCQGLNELVPVTYGEHFAATSPAPEDGIQCPVLTNQVSSENAVDFVLANYALGLRDNREAYDQVLLRIDKTKLIEELIDQRDRAEAAVIEKNRFLAAASHDLRQPLHAIGLFMGSLSSRPLDEASQRILDLVKKSLDTLGESFNGLLELSRLDANIVESHPVNIPLEGFFARLQMEFMALADDKGLVFRIEQGDVDEVYADEQLLFRVVQNLAGNAVKYTDQGSVEIVASRSAPDQVCIAVTDTGCGIEEDKQFAIFDEYLQLADGEHDRRRGMGLGLAIVRRLCDLMNLSIRVESSPGKGSTFTVYVPCAVTTAFEIKPGPFQHDEVPVDVVRRRIIVIDDERDILVGMRTILASWGHEVLLSSTGESMLEALKDFGIPDLVIADFRLGAGISGLDLIDNIRKACGKIVPSILVTGDTSPDRLKEAKLASVYVLHKPVRPAILKETIIEACKRAVIQRQFTT